MPMLPKVLVVDDSVVDRRIVGGLLAKDPFLQLDFAEDGQQALERIRTVMPNLVLTDLRMPNLDGLQLVRAAAQEFPLLPVILITAHGSGAMAIEALEAGAAGYVPKTQLADRLLDTVQRTLGKTDTHRNFERLVQYQERAELSFAVENRPSLIDPLSALIQQNTAVLHVFDAHTRMQLVAAFEQAFLNAVYHGNLEITYDDLVRERQRASEEGYVPLLQQRRTQPPYCERRVFVEVDVSRDQARLVVRDEGAGFDVSAIPDPTNPEELVREGGHGLLLMQAFTDELRFNDIGNEATLVKRRRRHSNGQQQAAEVPR
jgi:CheY-like chemotaxis protein